MVDISKWTSVREQYLADLISKKVTALQDAPEGVLRANSQKTYVEFYIKTKETKMNGRYLKKSEKDLVHALAQKRYDQRVLEAAEKEHDLLNRLNRLYESGKTPEAQFEREPLTKRPQIVPIQLPDQEFVDKWLAVPFTKLDFQNGTNEYFSDNEEKMRSKSEVIIANRLKKYNVPYRYECPLILDGRVIYPDFTILNVALRKEIYWEHLGMMDDIEYLEKNLQKIARYELNGYWPGDKLIVTHESTNVSLNMKVVDLLIKKFCL